MKPISDRSPWKRSPPCSLKPIQKDWLMRPGALTVGLRNLGKLQLNVLKEYATGLSSDEARCLQLPVKHPVWVREVVMCIDGVDCVVARSLTPLHASHGVWQGMRRLRSRPLADILYQERSIIRSAFEVARINRSIPLHRTSSQRLQKNVKCYKNQPLLARRSVFWRYGYPLLVAECFLPAFWNKTLE